MSFNVRGALSWDGLNSWPLRRGLVGTLLERHRPSVAGFQEVLWPVERFLAARLPGHRAVLGKPSGNRLLGARNPILFSPGLSCVDQGAFWLSETPERWSRSWGARMVRSASWLRLELDHRPLLVMNVHLDHGPDEARLRAGDLVLARLGGLGWPGVPAVLCGDFNCNAGGDLHARLLAAGFRDTFLESGMVDGDDTITSHHFQGRAVGLDRRIDWILCTAPLRTVTAAIVRDADPPRYPSDHYPVIAELEWS
jgi:endonuclease/exonuclease/phosphatase family metal-dependent hydrolase